MTWHTSIAMDSYRSNSEDRASVIRLDDGIVCMIADGVGGRSGGGAAADYFIRSATTWVESLKQFPGAREQHRFLRDLDLQMTRTAGLGEATAILAFISDSRIIGACVGDSVCWWITDSTCIDLTAAAGQKPWLGSGMARIQSFEQPIQNGTLLIATDGLSKYADRDELCQIARRSSHEKCGTNLIAFMRPPSGMLPDDVAVIVARQSITPSTSPAETACS